MAEGISVRLNQAGPIPLDIDLACAPGETLALVGPSGAGKTTLLRAVAGLYRPRAGRITCGGEVWLDTEAGIVRPAHTRRVGLVFQEYALFPHLDALANVMAALGHRPRAERRARAMAILARVHLEGLERRKPHQLSGGQRQRVALARALARDPAVLLLDEPFSAVDRRTRARLHAELADLRGDLTIPILLVTHDIDEAAGLADRMGVIEGGRMVACGAARDIARDLRAEWALEVGGSLSVTGEV